MTRPPPPRTRFSLARLTPALLGISLGCTCAGGPTAGGPTPYVRCAMIEPPTIARAVGALELASQGRTLVIEGATSPLRCAVFQGPALSDEPIAPALDAIEAGNPALVFLVGSTGEGPQLDALVAALAQLSIPTLVVLGGRDHPAELARAIAALPESAPGAVIDVSGFRRVQIAGLELVPVPGAPDGRYAVDERACGLGPDDVDEIANELGSGDTTPRVLFGFAAPSPLVGIEGGEAGSPMVRDLASRVGAASGVFAWPAVALERESTVILAPALVGPGISLADGSRLASGPVLVELSASGVRRTPSLGAP